MAIVNAVEILEKAVGGRYAVGAFNVTDLSQMKAAVEAAEEARAPLIIQTSVTPSRFLGAGLIVAAYRALASQAGVPVCLHLDHCTEVEYCKSCADAGYTNIMIDSSKHPFAENVRQTKEVCDYIHRRGHMSVEGELGTVPGVEDQVHVVEERAQLCDPDSAVEFVERTGVDLFAPAIGTAHGVYKSSDPKIDFQRLARIREELETRGQRVFLVVHGGTGLPEHTVKRLIETGGVKFNVSTELKHVLIDTAFEYTQAHRDEYDPGKVDRAIKEATKKAIRRWMEILGCVGKA